MYGAHLNFSSVTLPGVGGSLNAATAITSDKLQEMNRRGKKWRTDSEGNMVFHNEALLKMNQAARDKSQSLVNRDRDSQVDGEEAMKEIFGRRRARLEAFKEVKKKEYNFADDTELLSIPLGFTQGCKGKGKCGCGACKKSLEEDQAFREWSQDKRKKLQSGELPGEFAGSAMSFPISSPEDVSSAWSSVGRAPDPRKVMANIIKIAKKFGWESGLPQTVKDRIEAGESGLPSPDFREWPTKKRESLKEGVIKGEFAGPGSSFPVASSADVSAAWSSAGRAKNPRGIMKRVIEIAISNGWEEGLPESVKGRLKKGQSGLPE
jgi:hypothetical protein